MFKTVTVHSVCQKGAAGLCTAKLSASERWADSERLTSVVPVVF